MPAADSSPRLLALPWIQVHKYCTYHSLTLDPRGPWFWPSSTAETLALALSFTLSIGGLASPTVPWSFILVYFFPHPRTHYLNNLAFLLHEPHPLPTQSHVVLPPNCNKLTT
jgi:hypothetical protein